MLQIRVYAFYGKGKGVLMLLTLAFAITAGVMSSSAGKIISEETGQCILRN